jgi:hypothetical protein
MLCVLNRVASTPILHISLGALGVRSVYAFSVCGQNLIVSLGLCGLRAAAVQSAAHAALRLASSPRVAVPRSVRFADLFKGGCTPGEALGCVQRAC